MKTIILIAMLCFTVSIFALTGFVISTENSILNNTDVAVDDDIIPAIAISHLNNAFPNPFHTDNSHSVNISVSIKMGEIGTVTIFNILGQTVKSFPISAGVHSLNWDGKDCCSGIYFYKLITPSANETKKLVLLK